MCARRAQAFRPLGDVGEGLLDSTTLPLLRELRQTNAILFDFVLKRSLSLNGLKFPGSVFETRDFFQAA